MDVAWKMASLLLPFQYSVGGTVPRSLNMGLQQICDGAVFKPAYQKRSFPGVIYRRSDVVIVSFLLTPTGRISGILVVVHHSAGKQTK
jgi:hypothetical protein